MKIENADNYKKYHAISKDDESWWGLNVFNVGCSKIPPGGKYPPLEHPSSYMFTWESGRVFDEYQIQYISSGQGVVEYENVGKINIEGGTIFILHPGIWHRYHPDNNIGWNEHWVGFKGKVMDNLVRRGHFKVNEPVIKVGNNELFLNLFKQIIDFSKQEAPGYQQCISGALLYILGMMHKTNRCAEFKESRVEETINKAKILIIENIEKNVSPHEIAKSMNIGYHWFRKMFKDYTGMSPGQYQIELKIQRAKELLLNFDEPIKIISDKTGFESSNYFTHIFTKKCGVSPQEFKNSYKKKISSKG